MFYRNSRGTKGSTVLTDILNDISEQKFIHWHIYFRNLFFSLTGSLRVPRDIYILKKKLISAPKIVIFRDRESLLFYTESWGADITKAALKGQSI